MGTAALPQNHSPKKVMMGQTEPSLKVRLAGRRGPLERTPTGSCIPSAQDFKGQPHPVDTEKALEARHAREWGFPDLPPRSSGTFPN